MKRTEIEKKLKKELDKERYTHTLGVMYTAAALAMAHHANLEQAMYAGLLHDCAKCVSSRDKFKLCKKYDIPISPSEERSPFLLHAKLGALFAQKYYETDDEDILHAIQVHTTGAPNMNTLDKIIYIADYIEPGRERAKRSYADIQNLALVRKMAYRDLDETLCKILSDTLDYLSRKGGKIDSMTRETYEYYCHIHET